MESELSVKVCEISYKMQIHIKPVSGKSTGKTITLDVYDDETVLDVKQKLTSKEGTLVKHQRLMFAGMPLEDSRTLSDCRIQMNSILYLVVRLRGGMKIYVERLKFRKTIVLEVHSVDTIANVKAKIKEQEGISYVLQQLLYEGTLLDNRRTLSDYNIGNRSTLLLVLCRPDVVSAGVPN